MAYTQGGQFNLLGGQNANSLMNPQMLQAQIMTRKMRAAKTKALQMTRQYNKNPHKMNSDEVSETLALAQTYGYNVTKGKKKDLKASFGDILQGVGVGAIDGALLGMIPNSWYENRRNKNWAKGGRIGGVAASFMVPASLFAGAGKTALGVAKLAKVGKGAGFGGATASMKALVPLSGKLAQFAPQAAVKAAPKSMRALQWAAKNLTTAGQAARAKRVLGAVGANAGIKGGRIGAWGDVARRTATSGGQLERILTDKTLRDMLAKQTLTSGARGALSSPLVQGGLTAAGAVTGPLMMAALLRGYGREGNSYDPYQAFLDQSQMSTLPQMPQMPQS